ncbi:hypothetical protein BJ165DRAFT_1499263 [Panaeolus papilionaceus]|nr:hypothetical protein BJ165DRAFT_1499263 [Panaeolus papilionaceus]
MLLDDVTALTTPAGAPFDHPDADVILRSSDKEPVDFRLFKILLSLSSPFFSEIFTLPQPSSPSLMTADYIEHRGVSVIQMTEDRETLEVLLGLCIPISMYPVPRIASLQVMQKIIDAAFKFEMEGVQKHLRLELISARFIESQPLRVFAIAYRYGWDSEARLAARFTLRHPLDVGFVPELEFISGATFYRLQDYHRVCGEVASSRALLQPVLAEADDTWVWITCKRCPAAWSQNNRDYPDSRKWWVQWVEDAAAAVKTRPWGNTVKKWDIVEKAMNTASDCPNCGRKAREDLEGFSQMLAIEIERDIALVRGSELHSFFFNLLNPCSLYLYTG